MSASGGPDPGSTPATPPAIPAQRRFEAAARAVKNGLEAPLRRCQPRRPFSPLATVIGRVQTARGPCRALSECGELAAAADGSGRTLLHWAAQYNRASHARLLLATAPGRTALQALAGKNREAPLHTAARSGSVPMVALLVVREQAPAAAGCRLPAAGCRLPRAVGCVTSGLVFCRTAAWTSISVTGLAGRHSWLRWWPSSMARPATCCVSAATPTPLNCPRSPRHPEPARRAAMFACACTVRTTSLNECSPALGTAMRA